MSEITNGFIVGVLEKYNLQDSDDCVIVGKIQGTVHVGDKVYITNYGDDDDELVVSSVTRIDADKKKDLSECKEGFPAIFIKNGAMENIKPGTVIRSFEEVDKELIKNTYINAIGDTYIGKMDLNIDDSVLSTMSIADCAEVWRIYLWLLNKGNTERSKEELDECRNKLSKLSAAMAHKVLSADEIYCVVNKNTGETNLFSRTIKKDEGYLVTPPEIKIIPKAYYDEASRAFPADKYSIVKIDNGDSGNGIFRFLSNAFFLQGACGVRIIYDQISISSVRFVDKPDFGDDVNTSGKPVTNTELARWILLRGQLGKAETEEEQIVARIYYRYIAKNIGSAQLILPVKKEGVMPEPDENGNIKCDENFKLQYPIRNQSNGKQMVPVFTDWKHLRAEFGNDWNGLIQSMDEITKRFDVVINPNKNHPGGCCFISREAYEEMKTIQ